MGEPAQANQSFKLSINKARVKKGLKRKPGTPHGSSYTSVNNKPVKVSRLDTGGAGAKPRDSTTNLDAFLEELPDTVNSGANVLDELENKDAASVPATKNTPRTGKANGSKLDKINATFLEHPFIKQTYHGSSQCRDSARFCDHNGIHVDLGSGEIADPNLIQPITSWHLAGLPLPMMRVLEMQRFHAPSPIQAQSLPIIMSGYDMLGIAPTGSGKTAAFLIPLCRHVIANIGTYHRLGLRGPLALVMVPTRELCVQIQNELKTWAENLQLSTLGCYGGSDISAQISALVNSKCHIIVATPGRLIDLLAANNGRVMTLSAVTFVVIDETDRMFDFGFGPQVRKIMESIRPDRQTVVFSATMPKQLESLVGRILHKPIKVRVTGEGNKAELKSSIPPQVSQEACVLEDDEAKLNQLKKILALQTAASSIVFVNTQVLADRLTLELASDGIACQALHGGMDQRDRDNVISEFRSGDLPVLIATSVAARGLDVKNLKLVVNYDPASHIEDYIHRAGRTGRAGESGRCITLLLPKQEKEATYLSELFKTDSKIQSMAEHYRSTHKQQDEHKSKWNGFGGHGLAKLDVKRTLQKDIERDAYINEEGTASRQPSPELEENVVKKIRPDTYAARLVINDIPKEARVAVTSVAKQTEIADKYRVSLTLKGTYFATPKPGISEDQKLHLQIEGMNKEHVAMAYAELQEVIKDRGSAAIKTQGKYSVF